MNPALRRVAELALLGLVMVAPSTLLVPVHGSWAPVVAWAIGVTVAVFAAGVCAVASWPAWTGVPLGLALLVLVGPSVPAGALTVPAGETLRVLVQGTVSGWRDVVTVAVPIGTSGALLVPALLTGWVVGAVAGVGAAAGRWYPTALLGLPVGAVVAGVLGRADAPWWASVLIVTAAVAGLVWVVLRRGTGRELVTGAPGLRWRHPLTAAVILLSAVGSGGAVLGALGDGSRFAVRDTVAVPVTPIVVPSPLVEYRHLTVDLADDSLFSVTGTADGDRVRLAALDAYDGLQFTVGAAGGAFARLGTERTVTGTGPARSVTVTVTGSTSEFVPTVGELQSISFGGARQGVLTDDFRYAADSWTGVLPGGLRSGDTWVQTGVVPVPPAPEVLSGDRLVVGDFPVTATLPEVIRASAAEWTDGISAPADQLVALQQVLSSRGYFSQGLPDQLRSPAGHGLNRLVNMVSSTTMVGDDEQYAALMAVLARSLGIPARVVVGFRLDGESTSGATPSGDISVTGADLAAWVEVPFVGAGWVAFDPTPPRDRTAPDTDPPAQAGRHVADNQPPPAAAAGDQAQVQADSAGRQEDSAADDPATDRSTPGWPWWVGILLWVAAALLLALLPPAVVLLWKAGRRRRRRRTVDPAGRVRSAWREVLDAARDTGFRSTDTSTRTEISTALWQHTGVDTVGLAEAADRAEFVPGGASTQDAEREWTAATRASTALLERLTGCRRLRARLSVSSLRRRPNRDRDRWS